MSDRRLQAVIVEPRKHEGLRPVLENMCEKLPNVPITVMHGTHNREFAHRAAENVECVVDIHQVNAINMDAQTYSKLLTSEAFWDALGDREKTLVFQTDSGICGEGAEIEKFINYDYCGAPWKHQKKRVGNGGFSLRDTAISKRLIKENKKRYTGDRHISEDLLFVEWCEKDHTCKKCPPDVGQEFSSETIKSKAWAFHNNMKKFGKPICDFNQRIHELNKRATALGAVPDVHSWQPVVTLSN